MAASSRRRLSRSCGATGGALGRWEYSACFCVELKGEPQDSALREYTSHLADLSHSDCEPLHRWGLGMIPAKTQSARNAGRDGRNEIHLECSSTQHSRRPGRFRTVLLYYPVL